MKRHKVQVTRPSASERETQAILSDHPEILQRIAAFEVREMALISLEEVGIRHGVKATSAAQGRE